MELVTTIANAKRVSVYNPTANKICIERLTRENSTLRSQVSRALAAKSSAEKRKDIVEGLLSATKSELESLKIEIEEKDAQLAQKDAKIEELTASLALATKKNKKKHEFKVQAAQEEGSSSAGV